MTPVVDIAVRTTEGGTHQSRPKTSYPKEEERSDVKDVLNPLAKSVKGTDGSPRKSSAARTRVEMCLRDGRENAVKS